MSTPVRLSTKEQAELARYADGQWDISADVWVQQQTARLALASVIDARLLHIRNERLSAFGLEKDPERVTLRQMAALWRHHNGTVGQAFELAVADACELGVPEIVEPLRDALRMLGAKDTYGGIGMKVLGLEKVPLDRRAQVRAHLMTELPADALLRNARRGRPASAATVVERLTTATWTSMGSSVVSPQHAAAAATMSAVSQLGRADALLYTSVDLVPVSMKVNALHVRAHADGWPDVPLWITRRGDRKPETLVWQQTDSRHPKVVVAYGDNRWMSAFEDALRVLDRTLAAVDRGGRSRPPVSSLAAGLMHRRDLPLSEVTRQLREVHPVIAEQFTARLTVATASATLPAVDVPELHEQWCEEADLGLVMLGQRHLFLGNLERDGHTTQRSSANDTPRAVRLAGFEYGPGTRPSNALLR